jgi:polyhydroxyalkanoate synthesis repressor PhaR
MTKPEGQSAKPSGQHARVIRRYPNRRLYDTGSSSYVSLAQIKGMVLRFEPLQVLDSKTHEDVTRATLLQVLLEEETTGIPMLSSQALAHLIRFYGQGSSTALQNWFERHIDGMAQAHAHFQQMAEQGQELSKGLMGQSLLAPWMEQTQKLMAHWQANLAQANMSQANIDPTRR